VIVAEIVLEVAVALERLKKLDETARITPLVPSAGEKAKSSAKLAPTESTISCL
jgi:hypothetical protein